MAEFCLECLNKFMESTATEREFVLSRDLDLCEECGEWKRVVVRRRYIPALYTFIQCLRGRRKEKSGPPV